MKLSTAPTDRQQVYSELLKLARAATAHSYCPYSHFHVGAALLTEDGQVLTGCNVESVTFSASVCAERNVFCTAIAEGHKRFVAIAVISLQSADCWPCGVCRQFMSEFAPEMTVVVEGPAGEAKSMLLKDLLPPLNR
jgi:cytidine deaminase